MNKEEYTQLEKKSQEVIPFDISLEEEPQRYRNYIQGQRAMYIRGYQEAMSQYALQKQGGVEVDEECDVLHRCLTDLYECEYNNERNRIERIKACLTEIRELPTCQTTNYKNALSEDEIIKLSRKRYPDTYTGGNTPSLLRSAYVEGYKDSQATNAQEGVKLPSEDEIYKKSLEEYGNHIAASIGEKYQNKLYRTAFIQGANYIKELFTVHTQELKPLSSITDAHAIEVAKIYYSGKASSWQQGKGIIQLLESDIKALDFSFETITKIIDFLRLHYNLNHKQ